MKTIHLDHHSSVFYYLSKLLRHSLALDVTKPVKKKNKPSDSRKLPEAEAIFTSTPETLPKAQLSSALEALKGRDSQSEFIGSIIHELKNPLNAIIGFSELLKQEVRDPKQVEECFDYAKEINQAAFDLNELVHDLLDVGFAASGNFSVDLSKEIDIRNLVKRSVKLNYDHALKRGITIKAEIDDNIFSIKLDMKRMKQILANLISNAIKYSPEKTEIKIRVRNFVENNKQYLQIAVIDQGFGMTESQVQLAFQKYQTIQNPNSGKVDSFGLGLPITKQLVELQKGAIQVKSEPNKGTEIAVEFPYSM